MRSNPVPVVKEVPKEPTFTCPVCMNTMVEPSSTICGHVFCKGCIRAAIQVQKRCPNCRRKLTVNNFHRVYLPNSEWGRWIFWSLFRCASVSLAWSLNNCLFWVTFAVLFFPLFYLQYFRSLLTIASSCDSTNLCCICVLRIIFLFVLLYQMRVLVTLC